MNKSLCTWCIDILVFILGFLSSFDADEFEWPSNVIMTPFPTALSPAAGASRGYYQAINSGGVEKSEIPRDLKWADIFPIRKEGPTGISARAQSNPGTLSNFLFPFDVVTRSSPRRPSGPISPFFAFLPLGSRSFSRPKSGFMRQHTGGPRQAST